MPKAWDRRHRPALPSLRVFPQNRDASDRGHDGTDLLPSWTRRSP
jgi:hypothetical protein